MVNVFLCDSINGLSPQRCLSIIGRNPKAWGLTLYGENSKFFLCPTHETWRKKPLTFEIFQMKNSFGSSPVESTTSNSGPKSQNAQLNTPCTPALINWKEMAVLLIMVYFYSQTNQVLYKVCNWMQCWQEKRNFTQNYFHRNCISFIHFKCSWNDALQHHII